MDNISKNNTAVILVNYNGLTDSIDCIESICKTDNAANLKIVLVDNASKVNEADIIKEKYPDIQTIRSEVNGGFSYGNNLGIRWALDNGYKYITLLNNDTVVAPDMFIKLEKYCDEKSVAAPKMYYYSQPNVIWYGGGEINKKTGNAEHTHMNCEDTFDEEKMLSKGIRKCTFVTGCCVMVKAETFRKVGLLEEDYFMYCEDTDFCIRLQQAGIYITYVPAARLWHKISASTGGSGSPFSTYYMTRNRLRYIKKHEVYFDKGAYTFSFASRVVRMLQSSDKNVKRAFKDGISDHLKGIMGRNEKY